MFTSRFVGIFIMAFTLFRLRFIYLFITCCILLCALNIALIVYYVVHSQMFTDIWEALFLSLIAILMCCKASYSLEKHAKQNFLMKRLVDAEQKKIKAEAQFSTSLISNMFPSSLAENQLLQLAILPDQIFCKTTNLVPNCTTMFVELFIPGTSSYQQVTTRNGQYCWRHHGIHS